VEGRRIRATFNSAITTGVFTVIDLRRKEPVDAAPPERLEGDNDIPRKGIVVAGNQIVDELDGLIVHDGGEVEERGTNLFKVFLVVLEEAADDALVGVLLEELLHRFF